MAVARQNLAGNFGAAAGAISLVYSQASVSTGVGLGLLFGITWAGNPGALGTFNWDNGGSPQAMSLVGTVVSNPNSTAYAALFSLLAPHVGSTLDIAGSWANSLQYNCFAVSYTGVGSVSAATPNTGNSGTASSSIIVPAGGAGVDLVVCQTNLSLPLQSSLVSTDANVGMGMSESTTPGTEGFGWTVSGASNWAEIGAILAAAGVAPSEDRAMNNAADLILGIL